MALHQAIQDGDFGRVHRLLENKADPNKLKRSRTPLHVATSVGNLDIMECLLNFKADPNIPDHLGTTPLHQVARFGTCDELNLLSDNGANVNSVDRSDWTPLHSAFSLFNPEDRSSIVKRLLEKGASANAVTISGCTPLHLAVTFDSPDRLGSIEHLLESFCNLNALNERNETSLDTANRLNSTRSVQKIVQHSQLRQTILAHLNSNTWITEQIHFDILPPLFKKQSRVLAQLWSCKSNHLDNKILLNLICSLPLELFHVLLRNMWDEYFF